MIVLHINSKDELHPGKELRKKYDLPLSSKDNIVDDIIKNKQNVFVLVWMEGCGPCNATKPEWFKLESALKNNHSSNKDLVILDVNQEMLPNIKNLGNIEGFPTMKYFAGKGKRIENYEDSSIRKKDRTIDSFINWIENNVMEVKSTTPASSPQSVYNRLIKPKNQNGGKWTAKYKRSINCRRPKGFSQRQYCKYGRRKTRKNK
jgi:thiol-disulfide isomerase/thioredoxin